MMDYTIPVTADAVQQQKTQITQLVNQNPLVTQSVCGFNENTIVIGILNQPIFSRSEREKFVQELTKSIQAQFGKKVCVTMDTDLYYRISKADSSSEVQEIAQEIARRS